MREFDYIALFQQAMQAASSGVCVGIGDDAAVLEAPPQHQMLISCDNLVEGVHFLPNSPWEKVGYRAVVAALSDLAAMAVSPRWVLFSLTLPKAPDEAYRALAAGLLEAASEYGVTLVGGNTTRGPLNLGITVMGTTPKGRFLTRAGARVGDSIYVTGTLGDAALGLRCLQGKAGLSASLRAFAENRFWRPCARFTVAEWLHSIGATSCIDVSDGLVGDIRHILEQSAVGAFIQPSALPLSPALQALPREEAITLALAGGEDYELCFTAPPGRVESTSVSALLPVTRIGEIRERGFAVEGFPEGHFQAFQHF